MAKNITEEIIALLDQGRTSEEIIKLGYKKGTVYRVQREWRSKKASSQSPTKDRAATSALTPAVSVAQDIGLGHQTEQLEKTDNVVVVRRLGSDKENELLDMIGLPEEDKDFIKARLEIVLALLKDNKEVKLTEPDKAMLEKAATFAFANTLGIDIDPEEITRETRLWEDLEMDSLAFLEMFDEFQGMTGFDIDVNVVAKYAANHPVTTFGEFMDQMFDFIERREEILEELGISIDMTEFV